MKKTDYNAKILEIEEKYVTTSDYNKFTSDAKVKQKELVNDFDISNLIKRFDLKHATCNVSNKSRIKSRAR